MADELLSCPFCGSPAQQSMGMASCSADGNKCPGTYIMAPLALWNTRALPPSPASKSKHLHASGELRAAADRYWAARGNKSKIDAVYVKGDGYLRFEWDDGGETGSFHVRISDVLAAPAAPSPATPEGWRPIETAPKDGTEILTWDGAQRAVVAWSTRDDEWFLCDSDHRPEWRDITHWHPLPSPPAQEV